MYKYSAIYLFVLAFFLQSAVAQELKTPAPSPKATITQAVGVMDVAISYSRPGVKGREIFGGLVEYDKMWRTGANATTTLKFSDEVSLEGNKVPAGEYGLYTIPGKTEWTIVISKSIGSGLGEYKEEEDVTRFKVKSVNLSSPVERFTIEVADITNNSANIVLRWDKTEAAFKMECDTDAKVMGQIKEIMKNPPKDKAGVYYQSANYYFENGKDMKAALGWVNTAVELNPDGFWMIRLKSRIQAELGDYEAAIETAKLSAESAKKAGNDQYVKYNQEAIAMWEEKK